MNNIKKMLEAYCAKNPLRLHMPGHKGEALEFAAQFSRFDVTELSVTDDLCSPENAIKKAQEYYARVFDCKRALFSVNGSSAGNFAAVASGKVIIADRLSHKSVFSAARLMNKTCYVMERKARQDGLYCPVTVEDVKQALSIAPDADTVILTSPDYYGRLTPLEEIYVFLKSRGVFLFVDSAHGAHFGLHKALPESVVKNCDAAVVSVHKTLGGFNQAAVLVSDNGEGIKRLEHAFYSLMTSSPSFPIMLSIEEAAVFADKNRLHYGELFVAFVEFKKKAEALGLIITQTDDFTRLSIDVSPWGFSGREFYEFAESKNVFFEMYDKRRVVAIITLYDKVEVYEKIYSLIESFREFKVNGLPKNNGADNCGWRKAELKEHIAETVRLHEVGCCETIPVSESVGRIAGEDIMKMPPCVPIILIGEVITQKQVDECLSSDDLVGGKRDFISVKK